MKTIDERRLKDIKDLDYGAFSTTYTVIFEETLYCFKKFKNEYDEYIIQNLGELTERNFLFQYLVPLFVTKEFCNGKYSGYLSNYDKDSFKLSLISNKDLLIKYLKQARILIENLHNEYKLIHGDLNASNILVNPNLDKCYLIDFDSTLRFDQEVKNINYFSNTIYNYLKYQKFDKNVDVFKFNLMTLEMLTNTRESGLLPLIVSGSLELIEDNKDVKKLAKELLLYDTRKPLSGEYIIDYIK